MPTANRPQFWLQVRKEYILDNFENLISYLSHYDYNPEEDNQDYDSTLDCLGKLADEISSIINDTPFYLEPEMPYPRNIVIRVLCAYILASRKTGKTRHKTIITLATLLVKSDLNCDIHMLPSVYEVILNCIRRCRLVNCGFSWNDISSENVNEPVITYRLKSLNFEDAEAEDTSYYAERNGLLVIKPNDIPEISLVNMTKYSSGKFEVLFEIPGIVRILTEIGCFEDSDNFRQQYINMQRLIKKLDYYKPAPASIRKSYGQDDCFPVRIVSKNGWWIEAESVDPAYYKISGRLWLNLPPRRPKNKTVCNMLEVENVVMVYLSTDPKFKFVIRDSFEDYYRQEASKIASLTYKAVFSNNYPNGTEWITENGIRIGIDHSKEDLLDYEESEIFNDAKESRSPILIKTYKDAPDIYKEDFNVYGEPLYLSESQEYQIFTTEEADRILIRNFIEYSESKAEESVYGRYSGKFISYPLQEFDMLVPVIQQIGKHGRLSPLDRLEYNTACMLLSKMTGRMKDMVYLEHENRYLYETVKFASDQEVSELDCPTSLSDNPGCKKRQEIVAALIKYRRKDVAKISHHSLGMADTDVPSQIHTLIESSNSLIGIIDESELNNIKQTITRILGVEDEYVSILDDRTYYGVESISQEFKTSIVFPPYNRRKSPKEITDPDIQKWAIIKAVCGYLNSRAGGDVLLGVNDEGYATGLEPDIQKLYELHYIKNPDIDHYRLYVQRILTHAFAECGGSKDPADIANTHIDSFLECNAEGCNILRIKVKPYQKKIIRLAAGAGERPHDIKDAYVRLSGRTVEITEGMKEEIMKYKR